MPAPFQETIDGGQDTSQTEATTVGSLPDRLSMVLLVIALLGVVGITNALGYPVGEILVVFLAGILAALGVRAAAAGTTARVTAGVSLLWVAAVVFAGTTARLLIVAPPGFGMGTTLIVAAATLLVPFGLINSTLKSFGHGAGQRVLRRYLTGTLVVAVAAFLFLISGVFHAAVTSIGYALVSTAVNDTVTNVGVYVRAIAASFLVAIALYLVRKAGCDLPFDVFVAPSDFDRLDTARQHLDRVHHYGLIIVGLYLCVVVTAFALTRGDGHPAGTITVTVTSLGASRPVFVLATLGIVIPTLALAFVAATRKLTTISGVDVLETFAPPIALITIVAAFAALFGDFITETTTNSGIGGSVVEPGGIAYQFLTGDPSAALLLITVAALVSSAIVFATPSLLARTGKADQSLIGIAAAVTALTVLVFLAVFARANYGIILGGVIVAAVIWELGEYSIVAAGEVQSPVTGELPTGFTSLAAVHAVTTVFVAIVAAVAATILVLVVTTATITVTTAGVSLIFCTLALAVLLILLSG